MTVSAASRPIASGRCQPNIRSAWWLHSVITPRESALTNASLAAETSACSCSCWDRILRSALSSTCIVAVIATMSTTIVSAVVVVPVTAAMRLLDRSPAILSRPVRNGSSSRTGNIRRASRRPGPVLVNAETGGPAGRVERGEREPDGQECRRRLRRRPTRRAAAHERLYGVAEEQGVQARRGAGGVLGKRDSADGGDRQGHGHAQPAAIPARA